MIIIKIIILYFIQITHTDDLPSTGTRLVLIINRQEQASVVWQCHEKRVSVVSLRCTLCKSTNASHRAGHG